jgi:hypothetical protein
MTAAPRPGPRAKRIVILAGMICMILGPFWGYLAMFICKLTHGGQVFDTISFYMMLVGWMMAPIGILLLIYTIATRAILDQRHDSENIS